MGQFELKSKLHQVFTFIEDGVEKVGAILFVARKERYNRSELGVFTELMFRLLVSNYADDYTISTENILAIDLMSTDIVSYAMVQSGQIPSQLNNTLNEIQNLL